MSCEGLPGAPDVCEPGCWSHCDDYFGTGAPCGFFMTPRSGREFVVAHRAHSPRVDAGTLSLDQIARIYGGGDVDAERDIIEGWVLLDHVFSSDGGAPCR